MAKKNSKNAKKRRQIQKNQKARKQRQRRRSRQSQATSLSAPSVLPDVAFLPDSDMLGMLIIESQHLAEEPEFTDIDIDPMACVEVWGRALDKTGLTPEQVDVLSPEKQEDFYINIHNAIVKRMLTKSLRKTILTQLESLSERYQKEQNVDGGMQVVAINSFLTSTKRSEDWASVGLVLELFLRQLRLGLEFFALTTGEHDEEMDEAERIRRFSELMAASPQLQHIIDRDIDQVVLKATDSIFDGKWALNLFTETEIAAASDLLEEHEFVQKLSQKSHKRRDNDVKAILEFLNQHLRDLLTADRCEQMSAHIEEVALQNDLSMEQGILLTVLTGGLETFEETNGDDILPDLTKIMLSEIRYSEQSSDDGAE